MDGLQVDDSRREMRHLSTNDTSKMVTTQVYSTAPPPSTPYQPFHYQTTQMLPSNQTEASLPQKPRMPWGLSLRAYTFLIIGMTAVVMGAVLGGGLGGALAAKSNHNSSSTATVPATVTGTVTATATTAGATTTTGTATATPSSTGVVKNYSPLLPTQVNTTALNCTDQVTITSRLGDSYTLYCNTNYAGNDIVNFMAYTLDTCINACSEMNSLAGKTSCYGIMYNANMAQMYSLNSGNCWLKNLMASPSTDVLPPSVGAVLVT